MLLQLSEGLRTVNETHPDMLNCPACGQLIDTTELPIGTTVICPACAHNFNTWRDFDHYRLDKMVGEGGMGSVYLATDRNLERTVAIKVLKQELSEDKNYIANFLHEVEITASLTHPNIVHVFSFGEHEGQFYLVMEYIGHVTLDDDIVSKKKLSELEVLNAGIGVCNGLNFALQHGGLIHRDIKPGNILFGQDRTPKVVDFGLAVTREVAEQVGGEIWGTPYYVSPERLEYLPEDFRSDMYSLGVTLYHALAGRPPFDANTAELVASKHLTSKPLPLKTYAPYISDQTSYAIQKAMARYPQDRFNSYEEMIQQLEDAKRRLLDKNTVAPASNIQVMQDDSTGDKKLFLIVGGAVFGCLVLIGIFVALKMSGKI